MQDILQYFPLETPREGQVKALKFVADAVAAGYTDIVVEAPTGSGKTAIASTIAAWSRECLTPAEGLSRGAFVLVHQKVLQDQIEAELSRLGSKAKAALIKAAVEYPCPQFKRCSIGMAGKRCQCLTGGNCAYYLAKAQYVSATVAVTNYSYFLTEHIFSGKIPMRHCLVMDECHSLSRLLLRFVDVVVSHDTIEKFAPDISPAALDGIETLEGLRRWVEDEYAPAVKAQADLMSAVFETEDAVKEAYEATQHSLKVQSFVARAKATPSGWVFWRETDRDNRPVVTARPLDAAPYFDELVGSVSRVRVYMSAYPGKKGIFCRELGLDPQRVAWIRLKSNFDPVKRPVFLLGVASMSRANEASGIESLSRVVRHLAKKHRERGVIHTHSYRVAEAVYSALLPEFGARLVYPRKADEREKALQDHAMQPGAIIISPSIAEGFDFKDDLARWQLICKTPWPSLGDAHTKALADRSSEWYKVEALKGFVQACGRIVRSADDHGVTYVFDTEVKHLLAENAAALPRWFKEALLLPDGSKFFPGDA